MNREQLCDELGAAQTASVAAFFIEAETERRD
jgi:hypothetical protein